MEQNLKIKHNVHQIKTINSPLQFMDENNKEISNAEEHDKKVNEFLATLKNEAVSIQTHIVQPSMSSMHKGISDVFKDEENNWYPDLVTVIVYLKEIE